MKYPQLVSMPSAISDWLEEQLEARGIDGVVYTHYVLSLLHSHTLDIIYPDGEDLYSSYLKKEVRRTGGRNKRFSRSSSDWWKHAQADAEQIKRSAAVECLMSASDQNCEIESLVDELCEKLKSKDIVVPGLLEKPTSLNTEKPTTTYITPQELAEKYYAAFPPLRTQNIAKENNQEQSKLLNFMEPKWKVGGSPSRKRLLPGKQVDHKQRLGIRMETDALKPYNQSKLRFPYLPRMKNTTCRKIDWDPPAFKKPKSKSKSAFEEHRRSLPKADLSKNHKTFDEFDFDQCLSDSYSNPWSNMEENDHEVPLYDDLPVDLRELLSSPEPSNRAVEINMANMRDDGKRQFIAYGTNINGSIWSTDADVAHDNLFNAALDCTEPSETSLDAKFSSISINSSGFGDPANFNVPWPTYSPSAQNKANDFLESKDQETYNNAFLQDFYSLPCDWYSGVEENVNNGDSFDIHQELLKQVALSLEKLNHSKEASSFAEVVPGSLVKVKSYNPFTKPNSLFDFNNKSSVLLEKEKEDLLTSEKTHFKPIVEEVDNNIKGQYADGATFNISNHLDKVEYKRSESGTMFLENEYGQSKKYFEYKMENSPSSSPELEFVLKFSVCQNDKGCQTEEAPRPGSPMVTDDVCDASVNIVDSSKPEIVIDEDRTCTCSDGLFESNRSSSSCPIHNLTRPDSILGEVVWNYENQRCEKCNKNDSTWHNNNNNNNNIRRWRDNGLKDIWSGGEICQTCLNLNSCATPSSGIHSKLREDISQDGEQLLSDLSHLQKTYMEELPENELSCNLIELVAATNNEKKRRHSFIIAGDGNLCVGEPWSFASHIEEDCLIQMSTLPTLRSVTL